MVFTERNREQSELIPFWNSFVGRAAPVTTDTAVKESWTRAVLQRVFVTKKKSNSMAKLASIREAKIVTSVSKL